MANGGFKKKVLAKWLFEPEDTELFAPKRGTVEITVVDTPKIDVPALASNDLIYTGSIITPVFTGYDENTMTLGGTYSAVNVGNYTATFIPKEGYKWTDGGSSSKSVEWSIGKATPVVTLNTNSIQANTKLSEFVPDYSSSTVGEFVWLTTDDEFSKKGSGSFTIDWKFIPNDTLNYNELESSSNITITDIPLTVPTFANTFTCDGNSFTPVFDGFDSKTMSMSGTTSSDTAGIYTVSFDIRNKDKYKWADGQYATKNVTYTLPIAGTYIASSNRNLIGYTDTVTELNIPKFFVDNGKPYRVDGINANAFKDCTSLTSITIPNSVTKISTYAFQNCRALTSVTIPNSVTKIDMGAFNSCTSLTSVVIPDSITSIKDYTFQQCTSLSSVTMYGVKTIGANAFSRCGKLKSIGIGTLTSIGNNAFSACSSLAALRIPTGTTSIGNNAFLECTSLSIIGIPSSVTTIGGNAFKGTPWLTAKQQENPLVVVNGILIDGSTYTEGTLALNSNVKKIAPAAFWECAALVTITIPETVTDIGSSVFTGCSNLGTVNLPNTLTRIEAYTFSDCSNLEVIDIPNTVTYIGNSVFQNCPSLSTIYYNGTQEKWNNITKNNNSALDNIAVKFYDKSIILMDINRNSLIGDISSITDLVIPAIFTDAEGLNRKVITIYDNAFNGCKNLTSVTIPNSVTKITTAAFASCTSLASITIPNSVTKIESAVFRSDNALTTVNYTGNLRQWNAINITSSDNGPLTNATKVFNYQG